MSANALESIDALMRRPEFAQAQGEPVRDALVARAVAVLEVGGTETVVMAVVDRVREEGLQDCGEETYYNSEDEEEEVSEELAARVVGEMGHIPISRQIGDCCVQGDLQNYQRWDKHQQGIKPSEGVGVSAMFKAILEAGGGGLVFRKKPTGIARVIPKSSEKCSLIYNGIRVNSVDSCCTKGFRLPHVEGFRDFLPAKPRPVYMAKLDISSCFSSLLLPPLWRHIFRVQVGHLCYYWTRLPFGWACAPIVCQSVVTALVRAALFGIIMLHLVYLDDVLLAGTKRNVAKGYARVVDRFQKAGFPISIKSVSTPSKQSHFIGKAIDMQRCRVSNKTGLLASAVSLWLQCFLEDSVPVKRLQRLLGKLE